MRNRAPPVTPPFQIDRIGGFGSRNCYADIGIKKMTQEPENKSTHDEKYVCLSTEGQTVAVVHFVVAAMQLWKESDTVRIHHESGDVIITGDMAKRILEVNQMAGELLRMMREAGEDEAA